MMKDKEGEVGKRAHSQKEGRGLLLICHGLIEAEAADSEIMTADIQ